MLDVSAVLAALPANQLVSPGDLARLLRVSVGTIKNHCNAGKLPPFDVFITTKSRGWWPETLRRWNPSVAQHLASDKEIVGNMYHGTQTLPATGGDQ